MASKGYSNLSVAVIIVLGLFASGVNSQGPSSSEAPSSSEGEAPRSSEAPGSSEGGPVNEFCHTADHKDFCTKMVRGATTLQDATRNVVESTLDIAIELQKMYPLLEPAVKDLPPKTKKSVLDTCRQNFETTVDDLKDCLGFVEKNDKGSLNVHLSAATSSDCSDAFEGSAEMPKPIKDKLDLMYQAADNCLAVSEQI
ncbi:hypothetical protein DCAR_0936114 [Daucus carota subsp. sativus]|uniref:Pectinesterase inhibitor domain-containing protein n=1 Tax=Daucus carota subsp. sativus TaxID=79200 RepID=A0A175YKA9_DAUCS|nr:PREDICTED: uncharacterized protein LOC108200520 [Daucus carota subsp. sativus]WOH16558.1 hypothetical protein DCAR_0936114 [Daucus carota subsp. sativus]